MSWQKTSHWKNRKHDQQRSCFIGYAYDAHQNFVAQQQNSTPTTAQQKLDKVIEKLNPSINPFNLVAKVYELYKERQLLKQLNQLSNTSVDIMLNTSGKETAQTMGIAADNYLWAQKEIIKLGGSIATDAVGLAEGIRGKLPSSSMSGTEKAITTGVSQSEKQMKDLVPNPQ